MARSKSVGTVTITSGNSLSGSINLGSKVLCAIIIPASWTSAALSFQASDDGGVTFKDMFDDGGVEASIVSAAVVAGQRISVDPGAFAGIDVLKVRSGLTASAVTQLGDRVLTLVSRKFYALD